MSGFGILLDRRDGVLAFLHQLPGLFQRAGHFVVNFIVANEFAERALAVSDAIDKLRRLVDDGVEILSRLGRDHRAVDEWSAFRCARLDFNDLAADHALGTDLRGCIGKQQMSVARIQVQSEYQRRIRPAGRAQVDRGNGPRLQAADAHGRSNADAIEPIKTHVDAEPAGPQSLAIAHGEQAVGRPTHGKQHQHAGQRGLSATANASSARPSRFVRGYYTTRAGQAPNGRIGRALAKRVLVDCGHRPWWRRAMRAALVTVILIGGWLAAADPGPNAQRGQAHLTTKAYVPAAWSRQSYDRAWKPLGRRRGQAR